VLQGINQGIIMCVKVSTFIFICLTIVLMILVVLSFVELGFDVFVCV